MKEQKAKIRKTINYLIRVLIILFTYGFIYRQVFMERRLIDLKDFLSRMMEKENAGWFLALILFMMLVNWSVESVKWKILIAKIEKISFVRAFKAVMTGVSVSLFTPNRTGDYLGRVFILEKANHVEGILITIIGSFAQIIVTLGVGLFGFLTFVDHYLRVPYQIGEYLFNSMIFLVPCLVFVLLLLFFKIGILADFINRFLPGKWERFKIYMGIFAKFNSRELTKVLLLSFFRYLIFSAQFYLLLRIFGANLPVIEGFILIPVIYLIMAMVPTVALVELGVRGSVSIFVIGLYFEKFGTGTGDTEMIILAASSVLWLINLVFPAVLGTFFVFNLKFFRKEG
jgi:uncharacterized membrane protein YbhN (UPF0104 family)